MLASGDKEAQKAALQAANKGWDKPPSPPPMPTVTLGNNGSISIAPSTGGNQVTVGFGGKAAPPQQPFPEL
jgi:hypothetical protein